MNATLDKYVAEIGRRIAELQTLQLQLVALRGQCNVESASKKCGILYEFAAVAVDAQHRNLYDSILQEHAKLKVIKPKISLPLRT